MSGAFSVFFYILCSFIHGKILLATVKHDLFKYTMKLSESHVCRNQLAGFKANPGIIGNFGIFKNVT